MTFVRQTGRLRDRCTVYACLHTRSCAQPDWNVNSDPDFDDSPSTPSPSLGVSGNAARTFSKRFRPAPPERIELPIKRRQFVQRIIR